MSDIGCKVYVVSVRMEDLNRASTYILLGIGFGVWCLVFGV